MNTETKTARRPQRIQLLRLCFSLVLLTIVGVTIWASLQLPVWQTPRDVVTHPWFIATLTDTCLAFFTFWLWVAYRTPSLTGRIVWLLLIFTLGNIAIASYMLIQLWKLPKTARVGELLLRQRPVRRSTRKRPPAA